MRWLIAIGLTVTLAAGAARAATPAEIACASYRDGLAGETNAARRAELARLVKQNCPLAPPAPRAAAVSRKRAASPNSDRAADAAIAAEDRARVEGYRRAAAQGDADAEYHLGYDYYYGGDGIDEDEAEGVRWLRMSADKGDAEAQNEMGFVTSLLGSDHTEQLRWYRLAAAQDNTDAMVSLGQMYQEGEGVDADYAEALRWFKLALDKGEPAGASYIGDLYTKGGPGLKQDYSEAVRWNIIWEAALVKADADTSTPEKAIGDLYAEGGPGLPKDLAQARLWYAKAAAQGDDDAKAWLAKHRK